MAKSCLYCNFPLPDTADFCPQCGRPVERSFEIRPIQESESGGFRKEMKGNGGLLRQQGFYSLGRTDFSQLVLRMGYGPEVPPTPRRSVEDVLLQTMRR